MRILTVMILLLVSVPAIAAEPTCWPVLPSNDLHWGRMPPIVPSEHKYWAVWRCPDGIITRAFNFSEVKDYLASADSGTLDESAATAACATLCKPATPAEASFLRKMAVQKLGMPGKTISTNAYRRSIGGTADNPTITYSKVGTVAMGVTGGQLVDGEYCVIPQSAVKPTVPTIPLPLPVYGLCG
jgi:hypothetical protein